MTKMNVSKSNFVNITSNGNDLNNTLSTILLFDTILMIFYLIIGVSVNCFRLVILKLPKSHTWLVRKSVMVSVTDLTACVVGTSCFIALNTNPVNFFDESLCTFMLGSNMLFANLSASLTFSFYIDEFVLIKFPFHSYHGYRKTTYIRYIRYGCVVFAIIFSIPLFMFYGETDIVYNLHNISVSGKVCGALNIYDNYPFVQVYPVIVLTIYSIMFCLICFHNIWILHTLAHMLSRRRRIWSGCKYTTTRKIRQKKTNPTENFENVDIYADKDCSVVDSDVLICSTCNAKKIETNHMLLASNYDLITEQQICISDNTKSNNQTCTNFEYIKTKETKECLSCYISNICFAFTPRMIMRLIVFAVSTLPRAIIMILESNDEEFWSQLSETEYRLYIFLYRGYLLQSALNPFVFDGMHYWKKAYIRMKNIY